MIASRVWPSAIARSTNMPLPSGPRWASAPFIAAKTRLASGPGAVKPARPHMLPSARHRLSPWLRRMFNHAPYLIRRPASYLEIDPCLDLGHHAKQDEQNARNTDRRGEQRQRCLNERDAITVFENQRPGKSQRREAQKAEPNLAEKLDRAIE